MNPDTENNLNHEGRTYIDTIIRLVVFGLLAVLCWRIIHPFLNLLMWGLVLAVALYPLHQALARKLGNKHGGASTLMVLATLILIGVPMVLLALTIVDDVQTVHTVMESGGLEVPAPAPSVAEWPVIGERVYKVWATAATNMEQFQAAYGPQVQALIKKVLGASLGAVGAALLFLAAMVVAGIMMAYGKSGTDVMLRIANRLAGPERGAALHTLCVATVRSVATGVIGVAFIQALLFGIVFVVAGVPFPGLLALAVLITGIIQLPSLIFALPAIAYVWMGGDGSTVFNILMTVSFLVAGLADNVLKPMLLGRGVDAPMPVILIGALGGMFTGGFIGLFLGAVLLALCYRVFMGWVAMTEEDGTKGADEPDPAAPAIE